MTTREKLQIVTDRIRKDIPRLMELSEGCWVRKKRLMYPEFEENEYFYNHIRGVYQGDKSYILFSYDENGEVGQSSVEKDYLDKHFEVVGHEPMLNDVLEWLGIVFSKNSEDCRVPTAIDNDGMFFRNDYDKELWNLSKPYLKDQNNELIDFLYNLIEK